MADDPLLDIVAAAMMTQDAQDSMSSASWEDIDEDERDEWRSIAEAGIAALRDAKRLLPEHVNAVVVATTEAAEGFTERVEWGVRYPDLHPEPVRCLDEGTARRAAEVDGRVLMRRHVYTGPWEVVTEPDD